MGVNIMRRILKFRIGVLISFIVDYLSLLNGKRLLIAISHEPNFQMMNMLYYNITWDSSLESAVDKCLTIIIFFIFSTHLAVQIKMKQFIVRSVQVLTKTREIDP